MLGFLQGFSYGLFMTCLPWLLIGLYNPWLALAVKTPNRLQVILRYCLGIPFLSVLLWLTSLWGGFSPSLMGWLAGIVAIPVALPVERTLRGWLAQRRERRHRQQMDSEARKQRARQERTASEAGVRVLDPDHPPENADELVLAMCQAKQRLLDVRIVVPVIQGAGTGQKIDVLTTRFIGQPGILGLGEDHRKGAGIGPDFGLHAFE